MFVGQTTVCTRKSLAPEEANRSEREGSPRYSSLEAFDFMIVNHESPNGCNFHTLWTCCH